MTKGEAIEALRLEAKRLRGGGGGHGGGSLAAVRLAEAIDVVAGTAPPEWPAKPHAR